MTPVLVVSLLWLLAMLAATAHFGPAERRVAGVASALAAFCVAMGGALLLSPQPNWVGVLIGLAAFWRLIAGRPRGGAFLAGAGAGLVAALQMAAGLDPWLALTLACVALLAAARAAWTMAPGGAEVGEAVLLCVAFAAPAIGLAADIAFGWQSAAVLNQQSAAQALPGAPVWAIAIVLLALVAGVIRGALKRR